MTGDMYDRDILKKIEKLKKNEQNSGQTAEELYQIGISMQDEYLMGIGSYYKARAALSQSLQLDQVMSGALEAVEHARHAKDYDTLCSAYILLGIVSDIHCNYPLSIGYYMDARNVCGRTNNPNIFNGIILTNVARLYYEVHEYAKARYYNDLSIEAMQGMAETPAYVRDMASMRQVAVALALDDDNDIEEAKRQYALAESFRGKEGWDEISDMDQIMSRIRIEAAENRQEELMADYHAFMAVQKDMPYNADCTDSVNYLLTYMIEHKHFDACEEIVHYIQTKLDTEIPGVLMQVYDEEIRYYKAVGDWNKVHEKEEKYYEASIIKSNEEDRAAAIAVEGLLSVARLSEENTRLMKEAETDQLTGLPNRFAMHRVAEPLFDACQREQRNLGVELMDVDYFKEYNDTYGHMEGDECLKAVAGVIRQMTEEEPAMFAFRYGGDEIIILYDNLSNDRMKEIMIAMQKRVRELHLLHEKAEYSPYVTVSQGLYCDVPQPMNRLWDYTAGADQALYYVKNHHKGSWCMADHTFHRGIILDTDCEKTEE